jgi:invasion protein IalB
MRRVIVGVVLLCGFLANVGAVAFGQTTQKPAPHQTPPSASAPKGKPVTIAAAPETPAPAVALAENQEVLPSHWTSRCVSESRNTNVDCVVEQSAVVTKTGQLLADITIRVPADTRHPVLLIQLPVGLYLPAGVTVQVDGGKPQQITLQTCDLKGCYGAEPVSDEMLAAMKSGTRFAVSFQNAAKESVVIPFGLANFAEAYQRVQ